MNKRAILALLAFGVLLGAYFMYKQLQRGPDEAAPPMAALVAAEIRGVEIGRLKEGDKVVLKREGEGTGDDGKGWKLEQPLEFPAEANAVRMLLKSLGEMTFAGLVSSDATKHDRFELGEGQGIRVDVTTAQQKISFILGKASGGFTFLRFPDKGEVYQVLGASRYAFDKAAAAWRDKLVVSFDKKEATGLEVTYPEGKVVVAKAEGKWHITSPEEAKAEAGEREVDDFLGALSSLRAMDFADAVEAQEAGLVSPAFQAAVEAGGRRVSVKVGKEAGERKFYLQTEGSKQVYIVGSHIVDRLRKQAKDFLPGTKPAAGKPQKVVPGAAPGTMKFVE